MEINGAILRVIQKFLSTKRENLPTTLSSDRCGIGHVNELAVYAGLVNVRHAVCDAKSCREDCDVG